MIIDLCIESEDQYQSTVSFINLLSVFKIDAARFYLAKVRTSYETEFERCADCDKFLVSCSCDEDRYVSKYYREYDDEA